MEPTELAVNRTDRTLSISFDTGESFTLTAEFLRVHSPSAEVQGHSPDQKQTVSGKKSVGIRDLEAVGHYAVRIVFDDGHDTGLYTWETLLDFGQRKDDLWAEYLADLASKGLTR